MITFVIPGDLNTPTGGYVYDRRIIEGMRASGRHVDVAPLPGSFPFPTTADLRYAAGRLAAISDDAIVVVDGLAGGAMPANIEHEAKRLRIVALLHHPLARETGLSTQQAAELEVSERRELEFVRHVIVTSRATADLVARDFGVDRSRLTVVEPGTDPAPRAPGSPDRRVELLCVASLTPRKGHVTLMRALGMLRDLAWSLTCVGGNRDDGTQAAVERAIVELKIRDRVALVGEKRRTIDVGPYYDKADVFVLPTEYEGYGMAVAEALARGLPVISTPTGGIADLVGEDAGILVEPGNHEELADALRTVITDANERARLSDGAWRVGATLPTWDEAAAGFAAVLSSL